MMHRGLTHREIENCPYRHDMTVQGGVETACCGLVEQLLDQPARDSCLIARAVCESCCHSFPPTARRPNPVVASLIYARALRLIASWPTSAEVDRLQVLADQARRWLDVVFDEPLSLEPAGGPGTGRLAERVPPPGSRNGRRVREWAVGVTTAPRIQPVLENCLESLTQAGWKRPLLVIDAPVRISEPFDKLPFTLRDQSVGAWPNYHLALTELLLRHPRACAYMVVQDDALFYHGESLPAYLERILWPGRTSCLVSLYCSDADTAGEPGWHPSEGEMQSGPLALAFPRDLAKAFVNDRSVFEHRWDSDELRATSIGDVISSWAHQHGVPVWLPTPSLVQHIGETSTLWPQARAKGTRQARRFAGGEP
jgi:hypothetical protein